MKKIRKLRKLIILYRIISIILVLCLGFMYVQYQEKDCNTTKIVNVVNPNYVFLGDSITESYNVDKYYGDDLPLINSGISGDITKDILNDLENRVYRYNPSKVILLIGINNLLNHSDSPSIVIKDIDEMVSKIHSKLPNCEIYIESIYPMNDQLPNYVSTDKIIETNNGIKEICKKYDFEYINIFNSLLDKNTNFLDRKYSNDGLHMNEEGYKIITETVKKSIF